MSLLRLRGTRRLHCNFNFCIRIPWVWGWNLVWTGSRPSRSARSRRLGGPGARGAVLGGIFCPLMGLLPTLPLIRSLWPRQCAARSPRGLLRPVLMSKIPQAGRESSGGHLLSPTPPMGLLPPPPTHTVGVSPFTSQWGFHSFSHASDGIHLKLTGSKSEKWRKSKELH